MSVLVRSFQYDPKQQRYKFFWTKYVRSVNLEVHCQKCLIGPWSKRISTSEICKHTKAVTLQEVRLDEDSAQMLYLCGVTDPYTWERNFHLALRVREGSSVSKQWYGLQIELEGCEELPISSEHMDPKFPQMRDYLYRTCRNVQFAWGVQCGAYGEPPRAPPAQQELF